MAAASEIVLLGDIGATNARFALLADGEIGPVTWIEVARYPQVADAVAFVRQGPLRGIPIAHGLIAVAGPVEDQRCRFTNCPWTIDGREIREWFDLKTVRIVNDFEATALALPDLLKHDLQSLGGGHAVPGATMAVLGPGSGLGVAGLVTDGARRIVIASEGGHVTLSAASRREDAVLDLLREKFDHVSAERVLSGPGLENLYNAISMLDKIDAPHRHAAEITQAALQGTCSLSRSALDMFCALLGGFAGNVALTYGARGGVYIAGGIAPRIVDYLLASEFRRRFEQKGRFRGYLNAIPSQVIVHASAPLLGLKFLARSLRAPLEMS